MKYLLQFWKSLFCPRYGFSDEELAIIECLTKEADDIASGKYMTQSCFPDPIIPERRKSKR